MSERSIDMTQGSMLKKIIVFIIPIILTRLLQLCFTSADTVVIGRCVGNLALAAVGASSALNSLVFWINNGLGSGVSVTVSHDIGRNDDEEISKGIQSSVILGAIVGIILMVVGLILSRWALVALGTPDTILDNAVIYFRIILCGVPAQVVYQFAAASMRAAGDTGKPVLYLAIAGASNVVLNVFSVVVLKLSVVGVGLATAITHYLSAFLILRYMIRRKDRYRLKVKGLRFHAKKCGEILRIGVPAAIQGVLFTVSNIALQTAVNTMGPSAVSGNSIAATIDGYVFLPMEALTQACMVFSGQNVGAKLYDRSQKAIRECAAVTATLGIIIGFTVFAFRTPLTGLFVKDSPETIVHATGRLAVITSASFIYGLLDVLSAALRSYGATLIPTLISIIGVSGFRILWVLFYFPKHTSMLHLYLSYPLAWIICIGPELLALALIIRKRKKEAACLSAI